MRHYIPLNFSQLRARACWDQPSTPQAPPGRYHSEAGIYVRLSVMSGAIKYACFSDEDTLIPADEREILAGTFDVIPLETWHTIMPMTEYSVFHLDLFGLNRQ